LRLFRHGSIPRAAWKPESLTLDMWALYPLCAAGTDPQEQEIPQQACRQLASTVCPWKLARNCSSKHACMHEWLGWNETAMIDTQNTCINSHARPLLTKCDARKHNNVGETMIHNKIRMVPQRSTHMLACRCCTSPHHTEFTASNRRGSDTPIRPRTTWWPHTNLFGSSHVF
jgi:hypothetical protein